MPIYSIYTKIESNVPTDKLLYDLSVYRVDANKQKHFLVPLIAKQTLQSNYETQRHSTIDTNDPITTIYMVELMIYRSHALGIYQALNKPFIRMYTLEELVSGKACSEKKRENACYFESTGQSKPSSKGGNTITLSITIPERPFVAKEYPINTPKDPFEKEKFEFELLERMNHGKQFDFPDQGWTSLCGPAALFYCLLRDRPDVYEQSARELWLYGRTKIGKLTIEPSKGCRHPSGSFYKIDPNTKRETNSSTISGLDWITLASIRDSENSIMSYSEISDQVSGITDWWSLANWFEKIGYEKIFSNTSLAHSNLQDIVTLNEYFTKGYTVVSLISAGMLADYGGADISFKNHWIVWESPMYSSLGQNITLNNKLSDIANIKAFSWGEVKQQIKPAKNLEYILSHVYGALVFKKVI